MVPQKIQKMPEESAANPSLLDSILAESTREQARVASRYKPVLSIDEMLEREKALTYLVDHVMREGVDYGWVPGTKPQGKAAPGEYTAKPTLFKAGAERACAFFGYCPHYEILEEIEEWTSDRYGEPLFYYKYRCTLAKDGNPVGEGIGSGTTWESKHRYRKGERTCPACGSGAIIKGKEEFGGGWLCFAKKGGCGAKYDNGDPDIEAQSVEQVPNPQIADVINTVQKMGQKRAYVAATLTATGLSGRFTQDTEDMPSSAFQDQRSTSQRPGTKQEPPELTKALLRIVDKASADAVLGEIVDRLVYKIGNDAAEEQWARVTIKHRIDQKRPMTVPKAKDIARELWAIEQATPDPPAAPTE